MFAILERHPSLEPTFIPPEEGVLMERLGTAVVLGATAFMAYHAEKNGFDRHLPIVIKQIAESGGHPVLGYVGAWFGIEVARRKPKVAETVALFAATAVDIITEQTQDVISHTHEAARWYHHSFESSKDYAFALLGAAWFLHQNRKSKPVDVADPANEHDSLPQTTLSPDTV